MAYIGTAPAPIPAGGGGGGGGGATGGGSDQIFANNDIIITTDYTIPDDTNALTAGQVTLSSGSATITVPADTSWTVL